MCSVCVYIYVFCEYIYIVCVYTCICVYTHFCSSSTPSALVCNPP